jgi:hypothetical protein
VAKPGFGRRTILDDAHLYAPLLEPLRSVPRPNIDIVFSEVPRDDDDIEIGSRYSQGVVVGDDAARCKTAQDCVLDLPRL